MQRLTRHLARLLICCVAMAACGCTSIGPPIPVATADEIASQEVSLGVRTLGADGEFEMLPSRLIARRLQAQLGGRPLSVLALSGGGAGGAFGAGAIVGLTRTGTRPSFSVVTGVSAGALVAPLAFLGPQWDDEMTDIYTGGASGGLLRPRLLGAVFGSSLYSGAPLKRIIERYADSRMIEAIAAEAAKGRLLLVATTDFATGEPVIWDLGSIALHGGAEAGPLLRTVLLASASIPGMFPPVTIKFRAGGVEREETHIDGGVTLPFFISPAAEDLPLSFAQGAQPTLVRIVIDGRLRNITRPAKANTLSIFSRGISAGLSRMVRATLESTVAAVRQRDITLDFAAIPLSYPLKSAFDFGPDAQRSLFEYASRCAADGRLWTRVRKTGDPQPRAVAQDSQCPADDSFLVRFASLAN
jgi:predicted acylesterase/phospholipase RssA